VFSRTDTTTDSETFYTSILDLLEDDDEKEEVKELLTWWNRQADASPHKCSVLNPPIKANLPELHGIAAPCDEEQCIGEDQGEASVAAECSGRFIPRSQYIADPSVAHVFLFSCLRVLCRSFITVHLSYYVFNVTAST